MEGKTTENKMAKLGLVSSRFASANAISVVRLFESYKRIARRVSSPVQTQLSQTSKTCLK